MSTNSSSSHHMVNSAAAAAYLGLSLKTLINWRWKGVGPAFHRINSRVIRYAIKDLDAWLTAQRCATSDAA